jgi:hypothetical protein
VVIDNNNIISFHIIYKIHEHHNISIGVIGMAFMGGGLLVAMPIVAKWHLASTAQNSVHPVSKPPEESDYGI